MKALILNLRGVLRSWGTISLGDDRWTENHPTASAVLGMVGACAGIDKNNTALVQAWYNNWQVVSMSATQWSMGRKKITPSIRSDFQTTRNSLTMDGKVREHAIISLRGYVENAIDVVAIIPHENSDPEFFNLAKRGLVEPVYTPFLGRRCNPFTHEILGSTREDFASHEELLAEMLKTFEQTPVQVKGSEVSVQSVEIVADHNKLNDWIDQRKSDVRVSSKSISDIRSVGPLNHGSRVVDIIRMKVSKPNFEVA